MTSSEIGTWLENAGIIKHKQDLEDYLTAQNMTARIQTGTFEMNSSMTIKQIADSITRKP